MATIQRFEDLVVWQKARSLAQDIYTITGTPPVASDYRIKNQMQGSAGSIMDNIAEGFERGSRLEFVNALTVAKGEAGELKSQLYQCKDLQYLTESLFTKLYDDADEITKMLTGLIKYLNTAHHKGQKFKDRL